MEQTTSNAMAPFASEIPFTKEQQKQLSSQLANKVAQGTVNPIEAVTKAKALIECLTLFLKDEAVNTAVVNEVGKYGKIGTKFGGASLCVAEVGVRYDFSTSGDSLWKRLSEQKADIEAKMKDRQKFLLGVKDQVTVVDTETGEMQTVYAPSKTSSTTVKVTFAKSL